MLISVISTHSARRLRVRLLWPSPSLRKTSSAFTSMHSARRLRVVLRGGEVVVGESLEGSCEAQL